MSGDWQHGLFGCFDNFGLCIISYFVPCYTFGKNSEAMGESCVTCGLAYIVPIVNIVAAVKMRGKIREQRGIPGSTFNDLLMICCCALCALVQEAQEVQVPGGQAIARE
ncbi:protein PLANT CADMIUM RESISTANCE 3 [Elysia marginata]|uniref:Protein PLANT CADMIUM RESISTANCE 3 n=1 Tax=Elysia marginata TaxID=1093978 RepID=A0AAV4IY78_9GAST|nr:protein PLANT CADMIUM RESISTANCE 3 [Elysia marginata]